MRPYVAFIHGLPCVCAPGAYRLAEAEASGKATCDGRIEANHAGAKPGMGLKAPDNTCIPMCSKHHRAWTEHRGIFALWTPGERRSWADSIIRECWRAAEEAGLGTIVTGTDGWAWLPAVPEPRPLPLTEADYYPPGEAP